LGNGTYKCQAKNFRMGVKLLMYKEIADFIFELDNKLRLVRYILRKGTPASSCLNCHQLNVNKYQYPLFYIPEIAGGGAG
jgi:hypothetical protein